MEIGQIIRAARKSRKYTQDDMAKACKVGKSYISDVENGRKQVTTEQLKKLLKGVGAVEISLGVKYKDIKDYYEL